MTTQHKVNVGDTIEVTNDTANSGSGGGMYFRRGDRGVVVRVGSDSVSFDNRKAVRLLEYPSVRLGDFKVVPQATREFVEGDIVAALNPSECGNYKGGEVGVVTGDYSLPYPEVKFSQHTCWPLIGNLRKATPVEAAEFNLKKAQAELDAAKDIEKAEAEAKRKAEEEANRFTEEDVKSYTVVGTSKHSGRGALRMVIVDDDKVLYMNTLGSVSWTEPRATAVAFMNSMYYKTTKTLKDFANA